MLKKRNIKMLHQNVSFLVSAAEASNAITVLSLTALNCLFHIYKIESKERNIKYRKMRAIETYGAVMGFLKDNYAEIKELGHGACSSVVLSAFHKLQKVYHAIKLIQMEKITPNDRICIEREVKLLSGASHKNILKFIHSQMHSGYLLLYTICCDKSLLDLMREEGNHQTELLDILAQAADGVAYLHSLQPNPVIHRDLKPANIFLIFTETGYIAQIGDFGLAKQISGDMMQSTQINGTPEYMPTEWIDPQDMAEDRNRPTGDTWALGVILYEILEKKLPFPPTSQRRAFREAVEHMNYYPLSTGNNKWDNLIKQIFCSKEYRLSAAQIAKEIYSMLSKNKFYSPSTVQVVKGNNNEKRGVNNNTLNQKEEFKIDNNIHMSAYIQGTNYSYFKEQEKPKPLSIQELKIQSVTSVDTELQHMISPSKLEEIRRYYGLIRKIKKDDGNSCYRAVMFTFIERLTIYGTNYVHLFRDLIVKGESFFCLTEEPPELKARLLGYLEQIEKECLLEKEPESKVSNAHLLFVKMVLLDNYFDYALIRLLRRMIANFIDVNYDMYIEGISLQDMLQMNHMEFIHHNVLAEGSEASYVVIRIIPLLLRINIFIVDAQEGAQTFSFHNSRIENLDNITGTEIDMHDLNLSLLYDQTGFDVIYGNDIFTQIQNIHSFENAYFSQIVYIPLPLQNIPKPRDSPQPPIISDTLQSTAIEAENISNTIKEEDNKPGVHEKIKEEGKDIKIDNPFNVKEKCLPANKKGTKNRKGKEEGRGKTNVPRKDENIVMQNLYQRDDPSNIPDNSKAKKANLYFQKATHTNYPAASTETPNPAQLNTAEQLKRRIEDELVIKRYLENQIHSYYHYKSGKLCPMSDIITMIKNRKYLIYLSKIERGISTRVLYLCCPECYVVIPNNSLSNYLPQEIIDLLDAYDLEFSCFLCSSRDDIYQLNCGHKICNYCISSHNHDLADIYCTVCEVKTSEINAVPSMKQTNPIPQNPLIIQEEDMNLKNLIIEIEQQFKILANYTYDIKHRHNTSIIACFLSTEYILRQIREFHYEIYNYPYNKDTKIVCKDGGNIRESDIITILGISAYKLLEDYNSKVCCFECLSKSELKIMECGHKICQFCLGKYEKKRLSVNCTICVNKDISTSGKENKNSQRHPKSDESDKVTEISKTIVNEELKEGEQNKFTSPLIDTIEQELATRRGVSKLANHNGKICKLRSNEIINTIRQMKYEIYNTKTQETNVLCNCGVRIGNSNLDQLIGNHGRKLIDQYIYSFSCLRCLNKSKLTCLECGHQVCEFCKFTLKRQYSSVQEVHCRICRKYILIKQSNPNKEEVKVEPRAPESQRFIHCDLCNETLESKPYKKCIKDAKHRLCNNCEIFFASGQTLSNCPACILEKDYKLKTAYCWRCEKIVPNVVERPYMKCAHYSGCLDCFMETTSKNCDYGMICPNCKHTNSFLDIYLLLLLYNTMKVDKNEIRRFCRDNYTYYPFVLYNDYIDRVCLKCTHPIPKLEMKLTKYSKDKHDCAKIKSRYNK